MAIGHRSGAENKPLTPLSHLQCCPLHLSQLRAWVRFDVFFTSTLLLGFAGLFYSESTWGSRSETMQRLTARLLLLLALAGTFVPTVMQALAPPPHACCLRKSMHRCHTMGTNDPIVRSSECCPQQSTRAVTTSQWAHAQDAAISTASCDITKLERVPYTLITNRALPGADSSRAPPDALTA